jgi:hypothetical protein
MWAQRPIVEKHSRYGFYHPWTESFASLICDLPNKIATCVMFNVALYFMTNLRRTASAFFTYLLFMFVTILTMSLYFRTVGSLSRTMEQTMIPCSMVIIVFSCYTGFVIPIKDMVPWLSWLRRLNPIAYAYESLMINEVSSSLQRKVLFNVYSFRVSRTHAQALCRADRNTRVPTLSTESVVQLAQSLVSGCYMVRITLRPSTASRPTISGGRCAESK